jgi:hypothetical protein
LGQREKGFPELTVRGRRATNSRKEQGLPLQCTIFIQNVETGTLSKQWYLTEYDKFKSDKSTLCEL